MATPKKTPPAPPQKKSAAPAAPAVAKPKPKPAPKSEPEPDPEPADADAPLWPIALPVVGGTGDFASGKTIFGLTINPDPTTTRVYDAENSADSYRSLGFAHVDLSKLARARADKSNRQGTFSATDLFLAWREDVLAQKPGQWRVIMLDPVSEVEDGLVEWVRQNPKYFGKTPNQYAKSGGLFWADVKSFWKRLLSDIATRCECFYFTSHLKSLYRGNVPTNQKGPKGKDTLMELASLYLWFSRKPDSSGDVPDAPRAKVLKHRLTATVTSKTGIRLVPILPPVVPVATPEAIRYYMTHPAGARVLAANERAELETMTEEDKLAYRAFLAEKATELEQARLERDRIHQHAAAPEPNLPEPDAEPPSEEDEEDALATPAVSLEEVLAEDEPESDETEEDAADSDHERVLAKIREYATQLRLSAASLQKAIEKRGADRLEELDDDGARDLLSALAYKVDATLMQQEIDNG